MASPTPPHYHHLTPSKAHHQAPSPANHLPKKPPKTHPKPSPLLHSSPSPSPSPSSSITTTINTNSTPTANLTNISSPYPAHQNRIFTQRSNFLRPQSGLNPEFRRSRTTRVISKRNLTSPKPNNNSRSIGSNSAIQCLNKILNLGDARAVNATVSLFRSSLGVPEDYCFILHELGDRERSPVKIVNFFNSAITLMGGGKIDKGKLLTATIGSLGKMGRPEIAKEVFESGIIGRFGDTVFAHTALISAFARNGLASEAMGVLGSMKSRGLKPTTVSYNALIDAYGKGGVDLQFTLGVFREMLHDGLCPDRKTFNSLLAACSRAGNLDQARKVFDEMIHLGIGCDIYTYNTFIDAICKCGEMEIACRVMSDMYENNIEPNVVTYSTLIDGYSKLERFDEALKLYEKLKSLGIQLDRVCYNTLLSIYIKTGRYEEIARVCEEMDLTGIEKDVVTYNSLISGYGKQSRFDVVSLLIQDMREKGVAPSVLTYSTLIDIYSKAGMYYEAANAFLDFKQSGLKPDVVLYSSFIDILAKNGLIECAVWLLDEMGRAGIEPNVVTYNTVIDAFGKSKEGEGEPSAIDLGSVHGGPGVGTVGQIVRGIGRPIMEQGRRERAEELLCILELFQRMVQQGVRPNVVTFSAILNACSRCNSFEDASLLLEQLRLFDNFVYGVAHGLLMGHSDAWAQAGPLFDELARLDSSTSSAFYNALTDMLWHFGQRLGAQKVAVEGVNRRVWENAWSEFTLDLHLMSSGAAQAVVYTWLLHIRSLLFRGRPLPGFLSILTGWGRHSKIAGESSLRRAVESLLKTIGAPFRPERFNMGRFVSAGSAVSAWLVGPATARTLFLRDERSQPPIPINLVPSFQALQL